MNNDSKVTARVIELKKEESENYKTNSYEDPFMDDEGSYLDDIKEPPYSFKEILNLSRSSSILPQCIEAMEQNIEGFGYNLIPVVEEKEQEKYKAEIEKEKKTAKNFLKYLSFDMSFTKLRKLLRFDKETFGNAFVEVIRNQAGELVGFEYIKAISMRLVGKSDRVKIKYKKRMIDSFDYEEIEYSKRFRSFVQIVGDKKIYFKEFGDPRRMDSNTGKYITDEEYDELSEDEKEDFTEATEVKHFKGKEDPESVYGVPRFLGAIPSAAGSVAMEDVNYRYFDEKAIPPMVIMVAGGKLTKGTDEVIKKFMSENIRGKENFHKVLILEASGGKTSPNSLEQNKVSINMKELAQLKDAIFLDYDKANRMKVRSSFRLPPLYTGETEDYTQATAKESKKIAEEQVFNPEREDFDYFINNTIFPILDIKYIEFETKQANVDSDLETAQLYNLLINLGLTGNEARRLADRIAGIKISELDDELLQYPLKLLPYIISQKNRDNGNNNNDEKNKYNNSQKKSVKSLISLSKSLMELRKRFVNGKN